MVFPKPSFGVISALIPIELTHSIRFQFFDNQIGEIERKSER